MSGCQVFELGAGQHQYPFTFVLPTQIPSSFEGSFGHVRYSIRAVAQRPWMRREYECKTTLNVCSVLDLNTLPEATVMNGENSFNLNQSILGSYSFKQLPVVKKKSKTLGCFCCVTGPIHAQAKIRKSGYVPGETLLLDADTENQSGVSMRGSKAQFVQVENLD